MTDAIKKDLEKANPQEVYFYLMGFMQCQNEIPIMDDWTECQIVLTKIADEINKYRNDIGGGK